MKTQMFRDYYAPLCSSEPTRYTGDLQCMYCSFVASHELRRNSKTGKSFGPANMVRAAMRKHLHAEHRGKLLAACEEKAK